MTLHKSSLKIDLAFKMIILRQKFKEKVHKLSKVSKIFKILSTNGAKALPGV